MGKTIISLVFLVAALTACALCDDSSPLWKVFCQPTPIYRGRADPIVFPGLFSQHSHKVFGGSNFGMFSPSDDPLTVYKSLFAGSCTTASITIDKSNYWIPDLYYQWADGTFQLVPVAGLTAYYETRFGDQNGPQAHPKFTAFPPGFRMIAGNPYRRSYNESVIGQTGLTYACLSDRSSPETHNFPTASMFCMNGLRTQVYFPMCWNGKDLDTPDHSSHVAYPTQYNNGDCPATHPVRIPGLFYEVLYSVDKFPHGQGVQPFVWACGDPTGYGLHGDFLNGWDTNIMQQALGDVSCFANNTANGNNVKNCKTFAPYVKDDNGDQSCQLANPVMNFEDLGINHKISHLPGCNPDDKGPGDIVPCMGSWPVEVKTPNMWRVLIQDKPSGKYVSARTYQTPLAADTPANARTYHNVFDILMTGANTYVIQSEQTLQYVSANNRDLTPIIANKGAYDTWEEWNFQFMGGNAPSQNGTLGSILSYSDNLYVQLNGQGQLIANSKTPVYFLFYDANAGVPDTRTKKW